MQPTGTGEWLVCVDKESHLCKVMCRQLLCRLERQIPKVMLYHLEYFVHMLLYISHCLPAMLAYTSRIADHHHLDVSPNKE